MIAIVFGFAAKKAQSKHQRLLTMPPPQHPVIAMASILHDVNGSASRIGSGLLPDEQRTNPVSASKRENLSGEEPLDQRRNALRRYERGNRALATLGHDLSSPRREWLS
jgi:hypothetical protein